MENTTNFKLYQIPLDRWNKIMKNHELKNINEVLELLLQHYENTVQGFQTVAFCGDCIVPLALSCPKCQDAHAPPPSSTKDVGRAAKLPNSSQPLSESQVPLPQNLNASLSLPGLKRLAPKPERNNQGSLVVDAKAGDRKASGAVIEVLASRLRSSRSKAQNGKNKQGNNIASTASEGRAGSSEKGIVGKKMSSSESAGPIEEGTEAEGVERVPQLTVRVMDQTENEIIKKCNSMTMEEIQEELKRFVHTGKCDSKEYSVYVKQYVKASNGSCPICDKKVRANSQALHRHLCLHMPNVQYKCRWCQETFSTPGKKYGHMRKVHRDWDPHHRVQAKLDETGLGDSNKSLAQGAATTTTQRVADGGSSDVSGGEQERLGGSSGDDLPLQFEDLQAPQTLENPGKHAKSTAVLPAQPKIDLTKWNNMTVSQLNQELFSYVAKSQHETKEYMFFINTYLQKAYNGRCPMCNKAITKKGYLLRRHLCQHMPSPQLKCGWCDAAFHSVHKWYWHERRVHRRPGLPPAAPTMGGGGNVDGSNVDIGDRRHLSALKVMCNTILAKWDQMGAPEMQAELLRIVKESSFEGDEFTLFLSKYVKDFYSGSCVICNQKVHKNTKNFGDHLFIHMPNAKASCYYCSMTFESLMKRGMHMREAHRERFRKRQKPDAKCSGIQTAASLKKSNSVPPSGSPLQLAVSSHDGGQPAVKSESESSLANITDSPNVGGESLGQSQADEEPKASYLEGPVYPFLLDSEKRLELQAEMTQRLKMFVEKGDCESQEFMQFIVKYQQIFCGACPLCTKKLSRNMKDVSNFVRHLVRHMPTPDIKCSTCLLTFRSLAARETHIFKYHGGATSWVCELCGAGFHTKARFTMHIRTCQKVSYTCRHCTQQFTTRHFRFQHEKREHAVRKREHVCFRCGKVLNSPGELRNHLNTHTGDKKFQCYICSKSFYSRQGLTYHMAEHTSMPNRFECDVCKKKFRWKKNLTKHLQTHNTSRPFPCQDCGKAFKERGQLKKHLRIHTGERPYPCPEPGCGRAFITSCKRKDHCQRVHGYSPTFTIKTEIMATDFQSDVGDMTSGEMLLAVAQL